MVISPGEYVRGGEMSYVSLSVSVGAPVSDDSC